MPALLRIVDNQRLRRLLDEERTRRQALQRDNRRLQETLETLKEELDLTRRELRDREKMVTRAYDRMHQAGITDPLEFPLNEEGITLFEALPNTFTANDLFAVCDDLDVATTLGARHLEVYLDEEMVEPDEERDPPRYYKTGRQPYF